MSAVEASGTHLCWLFGHHLNPLWLDISDDSLLQALFQPTSHQFKLAASSGLSQLFLYYITQRNDGTTNIDDAEDDDDESDDDVPELEEALRPKCDFTKGLVQQLSRCLRLDPSDEVCSVRAGVSCLSYWTVCTACSWRRTYYGSAMKPAKPVTTVLKLFD